MNASFCAEMDLTANQLGRIGCLWGTLDHKLNMSPHSGQQDQVVNKRPGRINLRSFPPLCPVTGTEMPLIVKGRVLCVCVGGLYIPKMMRKHNLRKMKDHFF